MPAPGVCMNIISQRHRKDGCGTPNNPEKFLNQDYKQLKDFCLISGMRYIDDMFPPDSRSIGQGLLSPSNMAQVKWLRPWVSPMFQSTKSMEFWLFHSKTDWYILFWPQIGDENLQLFLIDYILTSKLQVIEKTMDDIKLWWKLY